jgi:hypothetical protein
MNDRSSGSARTGLAHVNALEMVERVNLPQPPRCFAALLKLPRPRGRSHAHSTGTDSERSYGAMRPSKEALAHIPLWAICRIRRYSRGMRGFVETT